jgi:hypothetical protein
LVGIGTTTPTLGKLSVKDSGFQYIAEPADTATFGYLGVGHFSNGAYIGTTAGTNTVSDILRLGTTGAERMRITNTGNVGIGTTSPSAKLQITNNSDVELLLNSTAGAYTSKLTLNASGGGGSVIDANGGTQPRLLFQNNGTTIASITSGGLCFGTDTAAANALDDYEEGTWTMGIAFGGGSTGITYNANTGTYTKIGRQVTVNGYIALTSKGSSTGIATITGLPFTIPNNASNYSPINLWFYNVSFLNQFQGYGQIGATQVFLQEITSLGAQSSLTNADFVNNSEVMISFTYFV